MLNTHKEYKEMDELHLFWCIRNGDHAAFTYLYAKYAPIISAFSMRYLRDASEAEDAVQHIFMKLWEKRETLSVTQSLKDYLYTSAKNYLLNRIRSKVTASLKQMEIMERHSRHYQSPEDDLERMEREKHIELATLSLSETKQTIVAMRRDGLSNKEISQKLNMPENTVKTYYAQSLKFFREYFKKYVLVIISFLLGGVSLLK